MRKYTHIYRETYYPWWEWYPDYEVAIGNLPVRPGDVIYVVLNLVAGPQSHTRKHFLS
jgi:Peptidase A4 family